MFSPYYAWARRRGSADPLNHCSLNVALYARGGRWSMTERGVAQVRRSDSLLSIGSSHIAWSANTMNIEVDEICAPLPRRLRGSIRVTPSLLCERSFTLDEEGLHRWTPYAPIARVDVSLKEPKLRFSGVGYLDCNDGDVPLEDTFREWTWSRATLPDRTVLIYDTTPRVGAARNLTLECSEAGRFEAIEAPAVVALPATRWRLPRQTRGDAGYPASVLQTLEDAPFYSRSRLETRLLGSRAPAIHEALSLDRFRSPWVQCLLPFRMPRIAR